MIDRSHGVDCVLPTGHALALAVVVLTGRFANTNRKYVASEQKRVYALAKLVFTRNS